MSWALLNKGYRIGYAEDAIVFTNVPERGRSSSVSVAAGHAALSRL